MRTVNNGTVLRIIWKNANETRDLFMLAEVELKRRRSTHNDKFDMAMFAVKSTENATRTMCSLRLNFDSLK